LYRQVLIFNLLPPPGSPPLQPDERGAAWSVPPLAVEVQAQVVDAMERVSGGVDVWVLVCGNLRQQITTVTADDSCCCHA
jgi:hypothetical protein